MSMPNAEYWAQRMEMTNKALLDRSFAYTQNIDEQFSRAIASIEKDTAAWYQRFASNNAISYTEAQKRLTKGELKEFRWTVEEYIKRAEESALGGRWIKELENASAQVHITRLEALKLHLQQQAELLHGGQLDALDAHLRRSYLDRYYTTAFEIQRGIGMGFTVHDLSTSVVGRVLARPWTADSQTFRDRVWTNKQALVNSVNTHLTQMIIRGEAPQKAVATLARDMNVSKAKAGRLIMTESAYFSAAAQKDCFNSLGVEEYVIVATVDSSTSELCRDMDGKVFKMSEYMEGLTAPPFHPWCRTVTAPYFADMKDLGQRARRNPDTGSTVVDIPRNMTYRDWKKKFVDDPKQQEYTSFKDRIHAQIRSEYPLSVNAGHQNKHIIGTQNFDPQRSTLSADPDELIKMYAGKGEPIKTNAGTWNQRERFTHTETIGIWRDKITGQSAPTHRGLIHYTKRNGAHIVPANPKGR